MPPAPDVSTSEIVRVVRQIAADVHSTGKTVATAESITSGSIAAALATGEDASEWFRGSIVAYSCEVKFLVLEVPRGPVITARCARQMAVAAARLLTADYAVATTGAGGPGREEGQPPGTVFVAVAAAGVCGVHRYRFAGPARTVVRRATAQALYDLAIATAADRARLPPDNGERSARADSRRA